MSGEGAPRPLLVIDLECTCDERDFPRDAMETIEIGAVLVDRASLARIAELGTFVRPVRRPALTPFCTQLTSIAQQQVDGAPLFPQALERLTTELVRDLDPVFCSWGAFDARQLQADCAYHQVPYPFRDHWNLKQMFGEQLGQRRGFGMARALARVGVDLVGTHHRGLDDARNIASLLPWCLGRRAFPPASRGRPRP